MPERHFRQQNYISLSMPGVNPVGSQWDINRISMGYHLDIIKMRTHTERKANAKRTQSVIICHELTRTG
jgi:hypothetical protein